MLKVENLSFRYGRRAPWVLQDVSLQLKPGEVGVLLGKNGSGKTTLIKNILCMEKSVKGSVWYGDQSVSSMSRKERARKLGYVPQNIQFGALSVFDSILMGRISYFGLKAGKEDYQAARQTIEEMGLQDLAERNVQTLSGGERQKVAIARAMTQNPEVLVFDEPTGNLDIANEHLILKEARRLAKEKQIAVLCSLHDLNQALSIGDRFFFLKNGRIIHAGGKEAFTEKAVYETFDSKVRMITYENKTLVLGESYQ